MAVSSALIKAAVVLAAYKRTWIAIGFVICCVILMIVGIIAAFLNIFSFDDSGSATASAAYVQFINDIKQSYAKLDAAADNTGATLDKNQIHALFYTLYFGEVKRMSNDFYNSFVECFVSRSTDAEGNIVVSQCDLNTALTQLAQLTGKMTDYITQQQVVELCSVLRY